MMTPEQFVHWLQGYNEADPSAPLPEKVKQKLKTVFSLPSSNTNNNPSTWYIPAQQTVYGVNYPKDPYKETSTGFVGKANVT